MSSGVGVRVSVGGTGVGGSGTTGGQLRSPWIDTNTSEIQHWVYPLGCWIFHHLILMFLFWAMICALTPVSSEVVISYTVPGPSRQWAFFSTVKIGGHKTSVSVGGVVGVLVLVEVGVDVIF